MLKRHVFLAVPGIFLLIVSLATAGPAAEQTVAPQSHLGKVDFPTSCSAEAQPLLDKGLALLHSFRYTEAHQTFEAAGPGLRSCDPYAVAYFVRLRLWQDSINSNVASWAAARSANSLCRLDENLGAARGPAGIGRSNDGRRLAIGIPDNPLATALTGV